MYDEQGILAGAQRMSELSDFHTLSTNSGVDSLTPSLREEDWGGPGTP